MLKQENSAILSTYIKLPFAIKIFVLSFFVSGRFTQVLVYMGLFVRKLVFGVLDRVRLKVPNSATKILES